MGREGIRVNVIVPGYIESDMTAGKFSSLGVYFVRLLLPSRSVLGIFLMYKSSHDASTALRGRGFYTPWPFWESL